MRLVALLLSTLPALSSAGAMGPMPSGCDTTFFAGGAAGVGMLQGNYEAFDQLNTDYRYARMGNDNFLGGALFGVQTVMPNSVYLALVGNALYNSQSATQFLSTGPTTAPLRNHVVSLLNNFQFGANIRLGMKMNNVTPYILGGAEAGTWEMGLANRSATWTRGIAPNSDIQYKKTLIGGQAGAGALIDLNPFWSIGMEYAHSWLSHISSNLLDQTTLHFWRHKAVVNQDQILFSVNYKFSL